MTQFAAVERRRQYCSRCGQLMFEYYRSPDGHFGVVGSLECVPDPGGSSARVVRCPSCRAHYRLLDRLGVMGQPIEKK